MSVSPLANATAIRGTGRWWLALPGWREDFGPLEPGVVVYEVWLLRLRALMAHAEGDSVGYRDYRDRYRTRAADLGFEGHMAWAEAMT
jgi:hypothetical protein